MHRTRSKVTIGNASDTVWFRHIITTCTVTEWIVTKDYRRVIISWFLYEYATILTTLFMRVPLQCLNKTTSLL